MGSGEAQIVSASNNTISVWDAILDLVLAPLLGHKGSVTFVAYSPDRRWIFSMLDNQTIPVWDSGLAWRYWCPFGDP